MAHDWNWDNQPPIPKVQRRLLQEGLEKAPGHPPPVFEKGFFKSRVNSR